jgi:hypothetical protein
LAKYINDMKISHMITCIFQHRQQQEFDKEGEQNIQHTAHMGFGFTE